MPLEPQPVKYTDQEGGNPDWTLEDDLKYFKDALRNQEERNKQLLKDIEELNRRAIDKTNAFLESDLRKLERIRELETAMQGALHFYDAGYDLTEGNMRSAFGLLKIALAKNKQRYQ